VLIPLPFRPLDAFVYWLLSKAKTARGSFLGKHHIRWNSLSRTEKSPADFFSGCGAIVDLNLSEKSLQGLVEELLAVDGLCHANRFQLKGMRHFFSFGGKQKTAWRKWLAFTGQLSRHGKPKKAMADCAKVFDRIHSESLNPAVIADKLDAKVKCVYEELSQLRYRLGAYARPLTTPISERRKGITDPDRLRHITGYKQMILDEALVVYLMLMGGPTILIGGPPATSKSTTMPALDVEFSSQLDCLRNRPGPWRRIRKLRALMKMLDLADPVADSIRNHAVPNRRISKANKREWTPELVQESVRSMFELQSLPGPKLVVADLPGRITEEVTEPLSVFASFGIILGPADQDEWVKVKAEWTKYFRKIGVPVIAKIKVTKKGDSMLVELLDGDHIYGRLRLHKRLITGSDPFIVQLAQLLMFNIIPGHLVRVHQRIEHQASGLEPGESLKNKP